MLEKWIDVYDNGKKTQRINVGFATEDTENV